MEPRDAKPKKRYIVIQRNVSAEEYEHHKARMESLGLNPSDPVPPSVSSAEPQSPSLATKPQGGQDLQNVDTAGPVDQLSMSAHDKREHKLLAQVTRSLSASNHQATTVGERIDKGKHERILAKWEERQKDWDKFNRVAAAKTGRPKEHSVVARADEYRERVEVMELLDRATPEEVKSGGHSWYHSLRGDGSRIVHVGNMFSGLQVPLRMNKEKYVSEIVRKRTLVELVASRRAPDGTRTGPRSWLDDEFLQIRLRRYWKKMMELAPGKLESGDMIEPECIALRRPASPSEQQDDNASGSFTLDREDPAVAEPAVVSAEDEAQLQPKQGPHLDVQPTSVQFHSKVKELCLQEVTITNVGTGAITFEWVPRPAEQGFTESVLPNDPTERFGCHERRGQVLPGAQVTMLFTFVSMDPGVFTCSWRLETSPTLVNPINKLVMHGMATQEDLLEEQRGKLKTYLHEQQVLHQVQELIDDIVESVKGGRPQPPDLSKPMVQERLFEDANRPLDLYWTPHAWQFLTDLGQRIKALQPPPAPSSEPVRKDPSKEKPVRGRRPIVKPPPPPPPPAPEDMPGVPCVLRLQRELAALPITRDNEAIKSEKAAIALELARTTRAAKQRPLERSPLWWLASEAITEIANALPKKMDAARKAVGLPASEPFLAPPPDDAPAAVQEEYTTRLEQQQEMKTARRALGDDGKEDEARSLFLDNFAQDVFGPAVERFGAGASEVAMATRVQSVLQLSFAEKFRTYLNRHTTESIELGGSVVMYELDLSFLSLQSRPQTSRPQTGKAGAPADPAFPPPAAAPPPALTLSLAGSTLDRVRQQLQGVVSVLESGPLALLLTAHLGEPPPDALAMGTLAEEPAEGGLPEDEQPPTMPRNEVLEAAVKRMQSLPSLEPIYALLKEIVEGAASSVEFLGHGDWLGDEEAFVEKVRDDSSENKVYLLENMSAFPEELGVLRVEAPAPEPDPAQVAQPAISTSKTATMGRKESAAVELEKEVVPPVIEVSMLTWATREAWANRTFGLLQPDFLVQDSWASASKALTTHTGYWPAAPRRLLGPGIEEELSNFFEGLQLNLSRSNNAAAAGTEASVTAAESAEASSALAPLLAVIGGGGFAGAGGVEVLLGKLLLLAGIAKLTVHERGGVQVALAGEFAVCVLSCLLGVKMGKVNLEATPLVVNMMKEVFREVLRLGVTVLLPTDVLCVQIPPPTPAVDPNALDPKGKKKDKRAASPAPEDSKKGKRGGATPVPEEPPAPPPIVEHTYDIRDALASASKTTIQLGFIDEVQSFLTVDPQLGSLGLRLGALSEEEEEDPAPTAGPPPTVQEADRVPEEAADPRSEAAPDVQPDGPSPSIPPDYLVKDVGELTLESFRLALRRSRGVLWNGGLGKCDEEAYQKGTRAFLAAVEVRLQGEDEEDEEEEEEEEEDDDEDEDGGEAAAKPPPREPPAEFEVAGVIGKDSPTLLHSLMETPSLFSFVSRSGEGLLRVLRGLPLPGLLACAEKG